MFERSQTFALALLLAGLSVLNAGCTSNRLMKSDGGFNWLGSKSDDTNLQRDTKAFPPPSSLETPQAVTNPIASVNAPGRVTTSIPGTIPGTQPRPARTTPGVPPAIAHAGMPRTPAIHPGMHNPGMMNPGARVDNSLVQTGLYDVPATPAPQTQLAATNHGGNIYTSQPPAAPSAPLTPPITTAPPTPRNILASATEPLPTQPERERSIYETEAPVASAPPATYAAPPATFAEPLDLPAVQPQVSPAYASEPIAPAAPLTPAAPPATLTANPSPPATFYEARVQEPRAWRPGSTSDLKTL